jgi:hypothetical protein
VKSTVNAKFVENNLWKFSAANESRDSVCTTFSPPDTTSRDEVTNTTSVSHREVGQFAQRKQHRPALRCVALLTDANMDAGQPSSALSASQSNQSPDRTCGQAVFVAHHVAAQHCIRAVLRATIHQRLVSPSKKTSPSRPSSSCRWRSHCNRPGPSKSMPACTRG